MMPFVLLLNPKKDFFIYCQMLTATPTIRICFVIKNIAPCACGCIISRIMFAIRIASYYIIITFALSSIVPVVCFRRILFF